MTISKERRDEIRAELEHWGWNLCDISGSDILALLDALDAAEKAEPVAWMAHRRFPSGAAMTAWLTNVRSREEADRYAALNPDETVTPLYTHPAPAVREGWVMVTQEYYDAAENLAPYHITRPPTADHVLVHVLNGDLRRFDEARDMLAAPEVE